MAAFRFRLVAASTRTSALSVFEPPSRWYSRSCSTRRNLACTDGLISPTSSRKSTPPAACSIRPGRAASAPVKAPFSWPNSSDSSRCSGSAAQFRATNGPSLRGEPRWMKRATTSLPVPDSPVSRTVVSVARHLGRLGQHVLPLPRAAEGAMRAQGLQLPGQDVDALLEQRGAVLGGGGPARFLGQLLVREDEGDVLGHAHRELAVVVVEPVRLPRAEGEAAHRDAVQADGGAERGAHAHVGVEGHPGVVQAQVHDQGRQRMAVHDLDAHLVRAQHRDLAEDHEVPVRGVPDLLRARAAGASRAPRRPRPPSCRGASASRPRCGGRSSCSRGGRSPARSGRSARTPRARPGCRRSSASAARGPRAASAARAARAPSARARPPAPAARRPATPPARGLRCRRRAARELKISEPSGTSSRTRGTRSMER